MFVFSLAKELKKTIREIHTEMDAAELMEWAAYFKATDEETAKILKAEIESELDEEVRMNKLRAFLGTVKA